MPAQAQPPIAIESRFADVNGTRLHYLAAGRGEPVYLLHGYAQTSHMWWPLIAELARTRTVIAPDLRGGVLFEGAEDLEAGAHAAGLGIGGGIEAAIGLRDRTGAVGGEIVPEMLEIDALASRDELERP